MKLFVIKRKILEFVIKILVKVQLVQSLNSKSDLNVEVLEVLRFPWY